MESNQLTFTGTDLQSAATLLLRRMPMVFADGIEPSATQLSAEALAIRTHERFLSKALCLSFSFVSSDSTLDFRFFG